MNLKNKKSTIVIIIITVIIATIAGTIIYNSSSSAKYQRQLEIADKFLEDLDYEQAIAALEIAISIEPMGVEAYLGMADAYVGMEAYEMALDILMRGFDLTRNEKLLTRIDEIQILINQIKLQNESKVVEEDNLQEDNLEFLSMSAFIDAPQIINKSWRDATLEEFAETYGLEKKEFSSRVDLSDECSAEYYYDGTKGRYHFRNSQMDESYVIFDFMHHNAENFSGGATISYHISLNLLESDIDYSISQGLSPYFKENKIKSLEDLLLTLGFEKDKGFYRALEDIRRNNLGEYYQEVHDSDAGPVVCSINYGANQIEINLGLSNFSSGYLSINIWESTKTLDIQYNY